MRYLAAIGAGAFIALLPPLLFMFPDFAWEQACISAAQFPSYAQGQGETVEYPCGLIDEILDPLWIRLLVLLTLVAGCVISGALAARIAEEKRMAVAFLAPCSAYVLLILWSDFKASLSPFEVAFIIALVLVAGFLGTTGVYLKHLTNAWRATRSKQRAPQA